MKRAVRTIVLVVAVACALASATTVRVKSNLGPVPLCPHTTICQ
jgi:hypothetical protein